jgi:hypothetical protein
MNITALTVCALLAFSLGAHAAPPASDRWTPMPAAEHGLAIGPPAMVEFAGMIYVFAVNQEGTPWMQVYDLARSKWLFSDTMIDVPGELLTARGIGPITAVTLRDQLYVFMLVGTGNPRVLMNIKDKVGGPQQGWDDWKRLGDEIPSNTVVTATIVSERVCLVRDDGRFGCIEDGPDIHWATAAFSILGAVPTIEGRSSRGDFEQADSSSLFVGTLHPPFGVGFKSKTQRLELDQLTRQPSSDISMCALAQLSTISSKRISGYEYTGLATLPGSAMPPAHRKEVVAFYASGGVIFATIQGHDGDGLNVNGSQRPVLPCSTWSGGASLFFLSADDGAPGVAPVAGTRTALLVSLPSLASPKRWGGLVRSPPSYTSSFLIPTWISFPKSLHVETL